MWYYYDITEKEQKAVRKNFWKVSAEHFKKHIFIFLWKCIQACHNNQQIKIKSVKANSRIRNFWGENEDEAKKNWENGFDLWILHIKIRLHRIFYENLRKKCLTTWLFNFDYLPDEGKKKEDAKMRKKMKKLGRMNLIFEFSKPKLGYMAIFIKFWEKKIDPLLKTFLTNQSKNKNEDEKLWKNESNF